MSAKEFAAIIRKVSERVGLDGSAKLTFEVSNGVAPMQLFSATAPIEANGALRVGLMPRAADCKPRDRCWRNRHICPRALRQTPTSARFSRLPRSKGKR
ncbi:hypothetical protein EV291_105156 [Rhizobium sp. BK068]|nr:hypothetical protein EV291_105156 [Rhizobium sp. BK068]